MNGGYKGYGLTGYYTLFQRTRGVKFLLLVPLVIFLSIFMKKAFFFLIFVAVTGVIVYYTKLMHFPIDISPLFFLEIVITKYYGIGYTLLFIFLGYIIPKTIAGQSMNWISYVFISISMISNIFVLVFPMMPLMVVGFLTSIIQYVLGVLFQSTIKPFFLAAFDGIANVLNNLVWFLIFSDVIHWIMI